MIVAIIPAAGRSERMGRPKLLLPLGPRRVIEHVLDAIAASRIDRTIVVVPPAADELAAIARAAGADVARLDQQTPDMRSTILRGLAHAESICGPRPPAAFLLSPADHPLQSPKIIDELIARFRGSAQSIVIPTHGGRRGHPVLFSWKHVAAIRAIPFDRGLNQLVAELAKEVEECPSDDPRVVEDMDTPHDYERMLRSFSAGNSVQ